jgi:hypothetical protein
MKKFTLSLILLAGFITFANAQVVTETQIEADNQIITNDDFTEVALTDLSEVIQEAIKNLVGETYELKKVEFNEEKELTRVTLVSKEDEEEKCVILDKEGNEVGEATEEE